MKGCHLPGNPFSVGDVSVGDPRVQRLRLIEVYDITRLQVGHTHTRGVVPAAVQGLRSKVLGTLPVTSPSPRVLIP